MSIFVKICGLMNRESICAAVDAKADALGFVFHKKSKRYISADQARELSKDINQKIRIVAVAKKLSEFKL